MWPEHPSGQAKWWCRRCERSGDGIDLLRELKGMGFREAAAAVGQLVAQRPAAVPSETRQHAPLSPPPAAWRSKSEAVAVEAEAALWRPEGARALAYLRGRGFVDDAVRAARLGYVVKDHRENAQAWAEVWRELQNTQNPEILNRVDMFRVFKHVARLLGAHNVQEFEKKGQPLADPSVQPDDRIQEQVGRGNMVPIEEYIAATQGAGV